MNKIILPALLLALISAGSVSARVLMKQERPSVGYVEVVREDRNCTTENCFVEYILLRDGTVMKKAMHAKTYDTAMPVFAVRKTDETSARALFEQLHIEQDTVTQGSATDPFNLYYFTSEDGRLAWSLREETPLFKQVYAYMADLFDKGEASADFYVHQYYQPLTGGTQALHIFADGTVINSVFDRKSYTMTSTAMFSIEEDSLAKIRELAVKAQAAPRASHMKCAVETGLEYGLVEFAQDGKAQKSFTCGTGSGDIPALFNYVRQLAQ